MSRTIISFSLLSALSAFTAIAVSGTAFLPPIYPGNAGRLGGTLGDGVDGPFDGIVDAADWTFNGYGGYEGAITLLTDSASQFEHRIVWEYDLSSVTFAPPLTATLHFRLRGVPIFPFPNVDVHVYAYTSDLAESLADYDSLPASLQGLATVVAFQEQDYQIDVSSAVASVVQSGTKRIGFRFQIAPSTPYSANQAFMDAEDVDNTTKPYLVVVEGGPTDSDGDGVPDDLDVCPGFDDNVDTDGDGVPDGCDVCAGFDDTLDADGDGVPDGCDACPLDNPDDTDADGVCDSDDLCPGFDDGVDGDGDGVPDGCDSCAGFDDSVDGDGDGVPDGCDTCPLDNPNDTDGDGICDSDDACPLDNPDDTDADGVCDSDDICPGSDDNADGDGDGVPNGCDACPLDNPDDTDADGVCDSNDICPGFDDNADGDGDGVPDGCDACPLDNPDDTDADGVCDSDDVCPGFDDHVDSDSDGIPDGCEIARPMPAAAIDIAGTVKPCSTDADCLDGLSAASEIYCIAAPADGGGAGTCYVRRNRYVSIDPNPNNAGAITARRVKLSTGSVLGWVGPPASVTVAGPEPSPQWLSRVESTPTYMDWSTVGTVHLGDCEISPGHAYVIQSIEDGSNEGDEAGYSEALGLETVAMFGDVLGSSPTMPPDTIRNFKDISALVRGFQSTQSEPKVWLDLQGALATPEEPDFSDINFNDINWAVKGFQGEVYPFAAPCDCPGQSCP